MHRPPLLTIKAILQPRTCYYQSKVGHQTHNYQQYHHHPQQQQQQHTRRMEETQTKPKRALDSPPTKLINTTENQSSKRPCHQDERIIDSTQNTDSTPSVVTQETPNAVVDPEKPSKNNGQPNQQKPKNQAKKPLKLKKGKKNNKADQSPLTISEQSLELSIKDLMGAETYETLLVNKRAMTRTLNHHGKKVAGIWKRGKR
ncbi:tRNA(m5U54)methyltransferase [Puccinia graminis f. sp. tritici]|uniref:tRNA(M5U54)methyltransferase n=1 Tax=Puccinia graminis f. sp. tritici TaxID=56615 RepID=A0A5B0N6L8_PUCGR|nr:tRNA(m5U54)methyltransferase [Puccinia graminis f. sp. tritici]